MPDSQSIEPGFKFSLLPFQSFDIFILSSCMNEQAAIDGGGNMSE